MLPPGFRVLLRPTRLRGVDGEFGLGETAEATSRPSVASKEALIEELPRS